MEKNYDDIINLPHHVSKKRPQMSIETRSAQFAPFAALTGYDEAVKETARLTDKKKNGGKYLDKTGIIRKVDMIEQYVQFIDKSKINIEDIISIESELFKDIETD